MRGFFQYLERKKYKLHVRVFLSRYRGYSLCSGCGGTRLRVEAGQVFNIQLARSEHHLASRAINVISINIDVRGIA